jgi:AhpD family alkylhydroperoxidase
LYPHHNDDERKSENVTVVRDAHRGFYKVFSIELDAHALNESSGFQVSQSHSGCAIRHGGDGENLNILTRRSKIMKSRMKNPAMVIPGALQALQALSKSLQSGGVPQQTLELVHLRASQINGCSVCVDMHHRMLKQKGETDERAYSVAAWRDCPYFTEAERAALALTEAVTRLSDRSDPVPDEIWEEAARHYDEKQLATLVLAVSAVNVWNRVNVSTKQIAGEWVKSAEARQWVQNREKSI